MRRVKTREYSRKIRMKKSEFNRIIKNIISAPTAPLHEKAALEVIRRELGETGVNWNSDAFGNLSAVIRPDGRAKLPAIAFVAHSDHPGFEIISVHGKKARARFLGGVKHEFVKDASVLVHTSSGTVTGRVTSARVIPGDRRRRVAELSLHTEEPVSMGDFGQWNLPAYEKNGKFISVRAADDLGGCATLVALGRMLLESPLKREVRLIFTRAEETGFCGALAMLSAGYLPKDLPLVSVETSDAVGEIKQGAGPVIRLGDRLSIFSPEMIYFMDACAAELKKKTPSFKHQRRIMDGGMCEATPFVNHGYSAAGISYPLVNYHNMENRIPGKPDRIAAEQLHSDDLYYGTLLMYEMVERLPELKEDMQTCAKNMQTKNKPFKELLMEKM